MKLRLGVVMDPIGAINILKDSTFAMLLAAQQRGWTLYYLEIADLFLAQERAQGRMRRLEVEDDPAGWFQLGAPEAQDLAQLDVLLMRKDPPFDMEYVYATYLLELAETAGCLVVNAPRTLRDANEKAFTAHFPQCCPPLTITRDATVLRAFLEEQEEIILKPLDGMGGRSIFRLAQGDPNTSVIIETLIGASRGPGQRFCMAQRFLPEIADGDKRVLIVDGVPVPYVLARIPAAGESRGNLVAGARAEVRPITERERWIAAQVAPALQSRGVLFAGLDVIGDWLTEINITSPTCIREIDRAHDTRIAEDLMEAIETRLGAR
ncbi:glutathione synthase [Halochromatium glycolicum]|uniref:Glutathione synthetase n=1 Tax=Halochromatium glycolicum TaxID=85075 RepID=A0AAJ0U3K8_9GAMM|nr:glutathione synthase [Halochromatium glycolicum]MBK1704581.1 glutathione synthase [Halochromatium glycolicum]